MGLNIVGNPNDYGGDDNPPEHGRDTLVYQELQDLRNRYDYWMRLHVDMPNDEVIQKAEKVRELLHELSDELNQPL